MDKKTEPTSLPAKTQQVRGKLKIFLGYATGVGKTFAMLEAAASEKLAGRPLAMRIGIHHGPAVAGVIGDKRTSYDIWGDTVNYAARLCQRSEPGRIQVSATFRRLGKTAFDFEKRGPIDIKGYGKRETFFLGRRQ